MKKCWLLLGILCPLFGLSQRDSVIVESCTASYYARAFEGRKCASGCVFRHDSLTAAHKTLKFGTRLKITNLKNDSTVIVTINDRLPKSSKRCIDLTKKAAKQLNFVQQGLTKVRLELVVDTMAVSAIKD